MKFWKQKKRFYICVLLYFIEKQIEIYVHLKY